MAPEHSTMTGLWLENRRLLLRRDLPRPLPAADESLVRVTLAGICSTDSELLAGYAGFRGIPGHEFVGVVVQGPGRMIGQRVVGEINIGCGGCDRCVAGSRKHCVRRQVVGIRDRPGVFAQYIALPTSNLHRVADEIEDERAVFVEPLAAALRISEQVELGRDEHVLVVGDGKLGQLVAQSLRLSGARVTVLGRHRAKLGLLEAHDIATRLTSPRREFDLVVDCTGSPAGFETARRALRPGGTLVLKSTYAGELTVDASALVTDEIRLLGSRCGPFGAAIRALEAGLDPRPLITARYPLTEALAAFEHAQRPQALKVLLVPGGR